MGGRRSEPPSYGEVEGSHLNVLSFHSKKGNGRTVQRRQRKEAATQRRRREATPPKEGRDRSDKGRRRGRRSSPLLFGGAPFLLLPWRGWGLFHCLPLGGADFPPLPCRVEPFPI